MSRAIGQDSALSRGQLRILTHQPNASRNAAAVFGAHWTTACANIEQVRHVVHRARWPCVNLRIGIGIV
jgi:hypothetical protein